MYRADEEEPGGSGADEGTADGRGSRADEPATDGRGAVPWGPSARYEAPPPLVRPWERRAGYDRRPDEGRTPPDEDDVPRWLPRPLGERVAVARHLGRVTRERTVGGARIVREVADGVREEAERVAHDAEERARATASSVRARRGVPTLLAGTAAVLTACTVLLVVTDPWKPSAGARGEVAWLLAVIALGLAAGRPGVPVSAAFRVMLLPAALLAVLAPFSHAESPFAWAMLAIPLMGAGGAVLVGLTAGGSRHIAEQLPAATSILPRPGIAVATAVLPRAAIAAATLAVVIAAWGVHADARVVDRTPARPVALSDRTGAFRGIEVGTSVADVRARIGTPLIAPDGDRAAGVPLDAPDDLALPAELPDGETWRYDGLALIVDARRVVAMVVADDRAQTRAGVGIGDSMDVVRRAYGGLTCGGIRLDGDRNPAYPGCRSRLPGREGLRRIRITFAGDPVESVVFERGARGPLLTGGDPR